MLCDDHLGWFITQPPCHYSTHRSLLWAAGDLLPRCSRGVDSFPAPALSLTRVSPTCQTSLKLQPPQASRTILLASLPWLHRSRRSHPPSYCFDFVHGPTRGNRGTLPPLTSSPPQCFCFPVAALLIALKSWILPVAG